MEGGIHEYALSSSVPSGHSEELSTQRGLSMSLSTVLLNRP